MCTFRCLAAATLLPALVFTGSLAIFGDAARADAPASATAQTGPMTTILGAGISPKAVPAGQTVKITYNWNAVPADRDYGVFVHITNAAGTTVAQDDHGLFPLQTSTWNGKVNYTRNFVVPASWADGDYKIIAGLCTHLPTGWYNPPIAGGAGTLDAGGQWQIGTITVDHTAPNPPLDSDGPKTLNLKGYKITFEDDFKTLDISPRGPGTKWVAHLPYNGDFGNAAFVDPGDGFPFSITPDGLQIEAKKDGDKWKTGLLCTVDAQGNGFTQKYGYFEMRAKFPPGPGTWPAFWLNTPPSTDGHTDANMELDVVEQYGVNPQALHTTMHWWRHPGHDAVGNMAMVSDMTQGFHNYGLLWTEKDVIWYFDGVEVFRQPTTPELRERPLYVLVNLALGGGWPTKDTISPSDMIVRYVKVYAKP